MRHAVTMLAFVLALPVAGAAQQAGDVPARPALPAMSDTNSATVYHQFGVRRLRQDPREAAAAFYWASRLNPEAAQHPYGRWVALVIAEPEAYSASREGDSRQAVRARLLDSLRARALLLDPFMHRSLDDQLVLELAMRYYGGTVGGDVEAALAQIMRQNPEDAALVNYSRGRFDETLAILARVAQRNRKNAYVRMERGRTFVLMGSLDSGRVQIDSALLIARRRDADSTRFRYEQKSAWEFSLGRVLAMQGRNDQAREAFERALMEDLSYFPAHIQLGQLHMLRRDTAAALREFSRAVESRADEYVSHFTYGYYLAVVNQMDSALVHLRRAIDLEPFAAPPRLMLGAALEAKGDNAGAITAYESFLARASRVDPDYGAARGRVEALRSRR